MSTITPHLWFDTQAVEAAEFYAAVFPDSKVKVVTTLTDTPSGDCDLVSFQVWGHDFMAISAGPYFKITPAVSFLVNVDPSRTEDASGLLDRIWSRLTDGGTVLMPLDAYPFSTHYGWVQDRFGVSWQLMLSDPADEPRPAITPALMFIGEVSGKAEEATDFYLSVFEDSERGTLAHYPDGPGTGGGNVMFTDIRLGDSWMAAMDSPGEHDFGFSEAVSLVVRCDSQAEIDHYWERLSAVPEAEQCGWLKDRYGLSWQITPVWLDDMLSGGTPEQVARVTQAFLPMKKFDLATIRAAYEK